MILLFSTSVAPVQTREDVQVPGGQVPGESASQWPSGDHDFPVPVARTDSPRATLESFLRLGARLEVALSAYWEQHDHVNAEHVSLIADEFRTLVDLSEVPAASRRDVAGETGVYLLDILGRIPLPNLEDVPDASADGPTAYAIPATPFRIMRIDEGPREGEFLFSAHTVQSAPRFYRAIADRPLRTSLPINSWTTTIRQLTGPMIPAAWVSRVPEALKAPVFGTPIWKVAMVAAIGLLSMLLIGWWHRLLLSGDRNGKIDRIWRWLLSTISVIVVVLVLQAFFAFQVNVSGQFSRAVDIAATVLVYVGLAWVFWLIAVASFEVVIGRRHFPVENLDTNMLRLAARIIGAMGAIAVLAFGAQEIGLPVFSILAGLGIGGLAIALAIRPTLENLIGGIILYLDKPVRVGDFCTFGERSGTVETIGVRSIQIRAMDRTLISVPNAQFADMQITNWARCDQMLIAQTIGLRYETDADQLRYALAKIREMFHGHPRIDSETVRVRFAGYGASTLDVDIRVYAKTREWNDFHAIKEDVLFRIKDIVEQSGTGFAFPSQTLYLGRDGGLDPELGDKAKKEVLAWRRKGQLPFPRFAASRLGELDGRLSYPPPGSPDRRASEEELADASGERLSAEPLLEESAAPQEGDGTSLEPNRNQARGQSRRCE